jgi:hypothetical protein
MNFARYARGVELTVLRARETLGVHLVNCAQTARIRHAAKMPRDTLPCRAVTSYDGARNPAFTAQSSLFGLLFPDVSPSDHEPANGQRQRTT